MKPLNLSPNLLDLATEESFFHSPLSDSKADIEDKSYKPLSSIQRLGRLIKIIFTIAINFLGINHPAENANHIERWWKEFKIGKKFNVVESDDITPSPYLKKSQPTVSFDKNPSPYLKKSQPTGAVDTTKSDDTTLSPYPKKSQATGSVDTIKPDDTIPSSHLNKNQTTDLFDNQQHTTVKNIEEPTPISKPTPDPYVKKSMQNIILLGRSRAGKSGIADLLTGRIKGEPQSLYAQTKVPALTQIEISGDILKPGLSQDLFILDTPGLNEYNSDGKARSDEELLSLIEEDIIACYGGADKITKALFVVSFESGINIADINSVSKSLEKLEKGGCNLLPESGCDVNDNVILAISRCEGKTPSQQKRLIAQVMAIPEFKEFFEKYKPKIILTGLIPFDDIENNRLYSVKPKFDHIISFREQFIKSIIGKENLIHPDEVQIIDQAKKGSENMEDFFEAENYGLKQVGLKITFK